MTLILTLFATSNKQKEMIESIMRSVSVDVVEPFISNEFQNLFNISKIDSWDGYVFPIDFYEILAEKPQEIKPEGMHLYHMNR